MLLSCERGCWPRGMVGRWLVLRWWLGVVNRAGVKAERPERRGDDDLGAGQSLRRLEQGRGAWVTVWHHPRRCGLGWTAGSVGAGGQPYLGARTRSGDVVGGRVPARGGRGRSFGGGRPRAVRGDAPRGDRSTGAPAAPHQRSRRPGAHGGGRFRRRRGPAPGRRARAGGGRPAGQLAGHRQRRPLAAGALPGLEVVGVVGEVGRAAQAAAHAAPSAAPGRPGGPGDPPARLPSDPVMGTSRPQERTAWRATAGSSARASQAARRRSAAGSAQPAHGGTRRRGCAGTSRRCARRPGPGAAAPGCPGRRGAPVASTDPGRVPAQQLPQVVGAGAVGLGAPLGPRRARVPAGLARWARHPAPMSSSATNRRPVVAFQGEVRLLAGAARQPGAQLQAGGRAELPAAGLAGVGADPVVGGLPPVDAEAAHGGHRGLLWLPRLRSGAASVPHPAEGSRPHAIYVKGLPGGCLRAGCRGALWMPG